MKLHESGQMYLETIYLLSKEKSDVRSLDVAEKIGYSQPSVCRAMGILRRGGFIIMDKDSFITLTDEGREYAEKLYDRHTTLTEFLIKLGISPKTAADDACKIEHDLSDESFRVIKAHVLGAGNEKDPRSGI